MAESVQPTLDPPSGPAAGHHAGPDDQANIPTNKTPPPAAQHHPTTRPVPKTFQDIKYLFFGLVALAVAVAVAALLGFTLYTYYNSVSWSSLGSRVACMLMVLVGFHIAQKQLDLPGLYDNICTAVNDWRIGQEPDAKTEPKAALDARAAYLRDHDVLREHRDRFDRNWDWTKSAYHEKPFHDNHWTEVPRPLPESDPLYLAVSRRPHAVYRTE